MFEDGDHSSTLSYFVTAAGLSLKMYYYRGTEVSFLWLVRSADPADRRCDRLTDGHNKGALGLLVTNT